MTAANPIEINDFCSFLKDQGWEISDTTNHKCAIKGFKLPTGIQHIETIEFNTHTKDKKNISFDAIRDFSDFYGISKNDLTHIIKTKSKRKKEILLNEKSILNVQYTKQLRRKPAANN